MAWLRGLLLPCVLRLASTELFAPATTYQTRELLQELFEFSAPDAGLSAKSRALCQAVSGSSEEKVLPGSGSREACSVTLFLSFEDALLHRGVVAYPKSRAALCVLQESNWLVGLYRRFAWCFQGRGRSTVQSKIQSRFQFERRCLQTTLTNLTPASRHNVQIK
ncbi:unnamed protein product, partial [Polarella glacialis]